MRHALKVIKTGLPYNFCYKDDSDLKNIFIEVPSGDFTADEAFRLIIDTIAGRWQVVALPGYAIMYGDAPEKYPSAFRYYRNQVAQDVAPKSAPAGDIEEAEEG
ncbi:hypothetical protein [Actinomadura terrae]|uniref:hypothetical protein n=1 Tax=Actinomadura terrae TaxID=604353 RepID=UPI001FA7C34B|nr:hypothetical protein [Actinomadura terrae]